MSLYVNDDAPEPSEAERLTAVLLGDERSPTWGPADEMLMHLGNRNTDTRYEARAAEIVTRLARATKHHQIDELQELAQRWLAEVIEDAQEPDKPARESRDTMADALGVGA